MIAPLLFERGLVAEVKGQAVSYKAIVDWTLWPGAAILVARGADVVRARLQEPRARVHRARDDLRQDQARALERGHRRGRVPGVVVPGGARCCSRPSIVALMYLMFDIPMWAALIAVPLAVLMGFIAARVTGETDVTPTKALGPVTQMIYGAITPGNLTGNIMSANVTGGIGLHAADLLTTLKTGWLLGAKPRHQLYAQLFGVVAGAAIIVPLFYLVVPIRPARHRRVAGAVVRWCGRACRRRSSAASTRSTAPSRSRSWSGSRSAPG